MSFYLSIIIQCFDQHFKSAALRACLESHVTEILREAGPEVCVIIRFLFPYFADANPRDFMSMTLPPRMGNIQAK